MSLMTRHKSMVGKVIEIIQDTRTLTYPKATMILTVYSTRQLRIIAL